MCPRRHEVWVEPPTLFLSAHPLPKPMQSSTGIDFSLSAGVDATESFSVFLPSTWQVLDPYYFRFCVGYLGIPSADTIPVDYLLDVLCHYDRLATQSTEELMKEWQRYYPDAACPTEIEMILTLINMTWNGTALLGALPLMVFARRLAERRSQVLSMAPGGRSVSDVGVSSFAGSAPRVAPRRRDRSGANACLPVPRLTDLDPHASGDDVYNGQLDAYSTTAVCSDADDDDNVVNTDWSDRLANAFEGYTKVVWASRGDNYVVERRLRFSSNVEWHVGRDSETMGELRELEDRCRSSALPVLQPSCHMLDLETTELLTVWSCRAPNVVRIRCEHQGRATSSDELRVPAFVGHSNLESADDVSLAARAHTCFQLCFGLSVNRPSTEEGFEGNTVPAVDCS